jgi:hypothetical protein
MLICLDQCFQEFNDDVLFYTDIEWKFIILPHISPLCKWSSVRSLTLTYGKKKLVGRGELVCATGSRQMVVETGPLLFTQLSLIIPQF